MRIEWNTVTWYSKLGAVIFFLAIFPIICFSLGKEYQKTIDFLEENKNPSFSTTAPNKISQLSGIKGLVLVKNNPYTGGIVIIDSQMKSVETTPTDEGKFIVFLPPGRYTLKNLDSKNTSSEIVQVYPNKMSALTMNFD